MLGTATFTIVVSSRIMKKPSPSASSASQGFFPGSLIVVELACLYFLKGNEHGRIHEGGRNRRNPCGSHEAGSARPGTYRHRQCGGHLLCFRRRLHARRRPTDRRRSGGANRHLSVALQPIRRNDWPGGGAPCRRECAHVSRADRG